MNLIEHLFDRSGNIDRRRYGLSMIALFWSVPMATAIFPPAALLFPVALYSMACLTVRRLHDIGLSGKWALMPLVAITVYIAALLLSGVVAFGSGMEEAGAHAQAWAGAVGGWLALMVFLSAAALVVMPGSARSRARFGRAGPPLIAPALPDVRAVAGSLKMAWPETVSSVGGLLRSIHTAGSDLARVNWLKLFFWPAGRVSRGAYIAAFVTMMFVCLFLFVQMGIVPVFNWVFLLVFFYCATSLASKRLHDFGQSGWWASTPFIVFYAYLIFEFWLFLNTFGFFGSELRTDAVIRALDRTTDDAFGYILLASLMGCALIGLVPGQRGANRYGDPHGTPEAVELADAVAA